MEANSRTLVKKLYDKISLPIAAGLAASFFSCATGTEYNHRDNQASQTSAMEKQLEHYYMPLSEEQKKEVLTNMENKPASEIVVNRLKKIGVDVSEGLFTYVYGYPDLVKISLEKEDTEYVGFPGLIASTRGDIVMKCYLLIHGNQEVYNQLLKAENMDVRFEELEDDSTNLIKIKVPIYTRNGALLSPLEACHDLELRMVVQSLKRENSADSDLGEKIRKLFADKAVVPMFKYILKGADYTNGKQVYDYTIQINPDIIEFYNVSYDPSRRGLITRERKGKYPKFDTLEGMLAVLAELPDSQEHKLGLEAGHPQIKFSTLAGKGRKVKKRDPKDCARVQIPQGLSGSSGEKFCTIGELDFETPIGRKHQAK